MNRGAKDVYYEDLPQAARARRSSADNGIQIVTIPTVTAMSSSVRASRPTAANMC